MKERRDEEERDRKMNEKLQAIEEQRLKQTVASFSQYILRGLGKNTLRDKYIVF